MPRDPFVAVADLSSLGRIRYLDARDQATFDGGHAPGAVRVPLEAWEATIKSSDHRLEQTNHWEAAIGALGLDGSTIAVTYDNGSMTNAARVWFLLQYFGANTVILNGGWPAISAAGDLPHAAPPVAGGFRAMPGAGVVGVVDRHILRQQLDGQVHVFDSRTRAEFTGEDARGRPRSGHLPGARHLSHADLMQKGIVHPAPVLRAMLDHAGFDPNDRIVTHCEGGGRAALAAAAAVRAGFEDVRVYYLSFADWVRDESCPIVRD